MGFEQTRSAIMQCMALLLARGGGALGSYQAGVYPKPLAEAISPQIWVA